MLRFLEMKYSDKSESDGPLATYGRAKTQIDRYAYIAQLIHRCNRSVI